MVEPSNGPAAGYCLIWLLLFTGFYWFSGLSWFSGLERAREEERGREGGRMGWREREGGRENIWLLLTKIRNLLKKEKR